MRFIWHIRGVSKTNLPAFYKETKNKVISPEPVSVFKVFVFGNQAMYPSGCMKKENYARNIKIIPIKFREFGDFTIYSWN